MDVVSLHFRQIIKIQLSLQNSRETARDSPRGERVDRFPLRKRYNKFR